MKASRAALLTFAALVLWTCPSAVLPAQQRDPCAARAAGLEAVDHKPDGRRPEHDRAYYDEAITRARASRGNRSMAQLQRAIDSLATRRNELTQLRDLVKEDLEFAVRSRSADTTALRDSVRSIGWDLLALTSQIDDLDDELQKEKDAVDSINRAQDMLKLVDAWAAHDKAIKDYTEAELAMRGELSAAEKEFEALRTRYNEQKQLLEGNPDAPGAIQAARDLKTDTRAALDTLKKRLLRFQCWAEVPGLIEQIEAVILKIPGQQRTALPGDVEEPRPDTGPLDLPEFGGEDGAVAEADTAPAETGGRQEGEPAAAQETPTEEQPEEPVHCFDYCVEQCKLGNMGCFLIRGQPDYEEICKRFKDIHVPFEGLATGSACEAKVPK